MGAANETILTVAVFMEILGKEEKWGERGEEGGAERGGERESGGRREEEGEKRRERGGVRKEEEERRKERGGRREKEERGGRREEGERERGEEGGREKEGVMIVKLSEVINHQETHLGELCCLAGARLSHNHYHTIVTNHTQQLQEERGRKRGQEKNDEREIWRGEPRTSQVRSGYLTLWYVGLKVNKDGFTFSLTA